MAPSLEPGYRDAMSLNTLVTALRLATSVGKLSRVPEAGGPIGASCI